MFNYHEEIARARRENRPGENTFGVLDEAARPLVWAAGNVTSQNGEDGMLALLFDRIGTHNRCCFEVGASDGVELSNTWALRQAGWRALLIEADGYKFSELCRRFGESPDHVHERITPYSLDRLLTAREFPVEPDLGIIDIDGQDLFILRGLKLFHPRVLLVEFNVGGDGILGGLGVWQAGAEAIEAAGRDKGYTPLLRAGCNVLFVDSLTWQGVKL